MTLLDDLIQKESSAAAILDRCQQKLKSFAENIPATYSNITSGINAIQQSEDPLNLKTDKIKALITANKDDIHSQDYFLYLTELEGIKTLFDSWQHSNNAANEALQKLEAQSESSDLAERANAQFMLARYYAGKSGFGADAAKYLSQTDMTKVSVAVDWDAAAIGRLLRASFGGLQEQQCWQIVAKYILPVAFKTEKDRRNFFGVLGGIFVSKLIASPETIHQIKTTSVEQLFTLPEFAIYIDELIKNAGKERAAKKESAYTKLLENIVRACGEAKPEIIFSVLDAFARNSYVPSALIDVLNQQCQTNFKDQPDNYAKYLAKIYQHNLFKSERLIDFYKILAKQTSPSAMQQRLAILQVAIEKFSKADLQKLLQQAKVIPNLSTQESNLIEIGSLDNQTLLNLLKDPAWVANKSDAELALCFRRMSSTDLLQIMQVYNDSAQTAAKASNVVGIVDQELPSLEVIENTIKKNGANDLLDEDQPMFVFAEDEHAINTGPAGLLNTVRWLYDMQSIEDRAAIAKQLNQNTVAQVIKKSDAENKTVTDFTAYPARTAGLNPKDKNYRRPVDLAVAHLLKTDAHKIVTAAQQAKAARDRMQAVLANTAHDAVTAKYVLERSPVWLNQLDQQQLVSLASRIVAEPFIAAMQIYQENVAQLAKTNLLDNLGVLSNRLGGEHDAGVAVAKWFAALDNHTQHIIIQVAEDAGATILSRVLTRLARGEKFENVFLTMAATADADTLLLRQQLAMVRTFVASVINVNAKLPLALLAYRSEETAEQLSSRLKSLRSHAGKINDTTVLAAILNSYQPLFLVADQSTIAKKQVVYALYDAIFTQRHLPTALFAKMDRDCLAAYIDHCVAMLASPDTTTAQTARIVLDRISDYVNSPTAPRELRQDFMRKLDQQASQLYLTKFTQYLPGTASAEQQTYGGIWIQRMLANPDAVAELTDEQFDDLVERYRLYSKFLKTDEYENLKSGIDQLWEELKQKQAAVDQELDKGVISLAQALARKDSLNNEYEQRIQRLEEKNQQQLKFKSDTAVIELFKQLKDSDAYVNNEVAQQRLANYLVTELNKSGEGMISSLLRSWLIGDLGDVLSESSWLRRKLDALLPKDSFIRTELKKTQAATTEIGPAPDTLFDEKMSQDLLLRADMARLTKMSTKDWESFCNQILSRADLEQFFLKLSIRSITEHTEISRREFITEKFVKFLVSSGKALTSQQWKVALDSLDTTQIEKILKAYKNSPEQLDLIETAIMAMPLSDLSESVLQNLTKALRLRILKLPENHQRLSARQCAALAHDFSEHEKESIINAMLAKVKDYSLEDKTSIALIAKVLNNLMLGFSADMFLRAVNHLNETDQKQVAELVLRDEEFVASVMAKMRERQTYLQDIKSPEGILKFFEDLFAASFGTSQRVIDQRIISRIFSALLMSDGPAIFKAKHVTESGKDFLRLMLKNLWYQDKFIENLSPQWVSFILSDPQLINDWIVSAIKDNDGNLVYQDKNGNKIFDRAAELGLIDVFFKKEGIPEVKKFRTEFAHYVTGYIAKAYKPGDDENNIRLAESLLSHDGFIKVISARLNEKQAVASDGIEKFSQDVAAASFGTSQRVIEQRIIRDIFETYLNKKGPEIFKSLSAAAQDFLRSAIIDLWYKPGFMETRSAEWMRFILSDPVLVNKFIVRNSKPEEIEQSGLLYQDCNGNNAFKRVAQLGLTDVFYTVALGAGTKNVRALKTEFWGYIPNFIVQSFVEGQPNIKALAKLQRDYIEKRHVRGVIALLDISASDATPAEAKTFIGFQLLVDSSNELRKFMQKRPDDLVGDALIAAGIETDYQDSVIQCIRNVVRADGNANTSEKKFKSVLLANQDKYTLMQNTLKVLTNANTLDQGNLLTDSQQAIIVQAKEECDWEMKKQARYKGETLFSKWIPNFMLRAWHAICEIGYKPEYVTSCEKLHRGEIAVEAKKAIESEQAMAVDRQKAAAAMTQTRAPTFPTKQRSSIGVTVTHTEVKSEAVNSELRLGKRN